MITVPQLDLVQNLDPTDVIIITHSNGTSEKITGADFLKGVTPVDTITASDMHPVTSNAVAGILPVDAVTSGNLHSVTSNAVAGAISTEVTNRNAAITAAINTEVTNRNNAINNCIGYSTTEKFTGGYWIDGKPIYQIVYLETQRNSGSNTITIRTDIDTPIRGYCITYVNKYNEKQNDTPWVDSGYIYACRMTKSGANTKFETYMNNGMQMYIAPIYNVYTVWYYTKV